MPTSIGHTLAGLFLKETRLFTPAETVFKSLLVSVILANLADIDFLPGLILGNPNQRGKPEAVAFELELAQSEGVPIRLPFQIRARPEAMKRCLSTNPDVPPRLRNLEQAKRVAWRLVYNWIDVQLAFVEAGQAEMAELMLGFALSTRSDSEGRPKTFYDVLLGAEGPRLLAEHL